MAGWLFKSKTYDNCNCAINSGCQFNSPSTHGYCQSAFVGNIVADDFNNTPLASLNWAALYEWPREIAEGNGKRQIVIDERADETQRIALERIISGEAGAPLSNLFSVFASTCSECREQQPSANSSRGGQRTKRSASSRSTIQCQATCPSSADTMMMPAGRVLGRCRNTARTGATSSNTAS